MKTDRAPVFVHRMEEIDKRRRGNRSGCDKHQQIDRQASCIKTQPIGLPPRAADKQKNDKRNGESDCQRLDD